ncbi:hypothetical protein BKA61DRAFT_714688 [Leptodontidium sp. MPI-SDFR-AT-0119]|nr:hypothetical protein BKA61DRAFT_714688 [Leptodontidium sp. MPI-SDFR-AT-0119]
MASLEGAGVGAGGKAAPDHGQVCRTKKSSADYITSAFRSRSKIISAIDSGPSIQERYREWNRQQKARRRLQLPATSLLQSTPNIGGLNPFPNLEIQEQLETVANITTSQQQQIARVKIAIGLLRDEFDLQAAASQSFPQEITSSHIRASVSKYEDEMSAASERSVCCCCGRLIATGDVYKIDDEADFTLPPQRILDRCGHHENSWDFCAVCHGAVSRSNIPKFSALNLVNVTTCQDYPSALEDLTTVEECLIAKCHPIGTILKLRPGGRTSPITYNAIRGHMIVIPQDPGPLLQILPSPELKLDNLIKVFWLGKRAPADIDLKPFL